MSAPTGPTYPDVSVRLTGTDGNVFMIIGKASSAIRRVHGNDAAATFANEAMAQDSYDAVLQLAMRTVEVR